MRCLPYIHWPYEDVELERLRRLERMAEIEDEKERIRQRLRLRGVNPDYPYPLPPIHMLPKPPMKTMGEGPTINDVIRRLG